MIVRSIHARPVRVCITGARGSGKTALATAIGTALGAPVIFGTTHRPFLQDATSDRGAHREDIGQIVEIQAKLEDRAPLAVPLLVLDTDVFTAVVQGERQRHSRLEQLDELLDSRQRSEQRIDLYVLTPPNEEQGGDRPSPSRYEMHRTFREELTPSGRRFVEVSGPLELQCAMAIAALEDFLLQEAVVALSSS